MINSFLQTRQARRINSTNLLLSKMRTATLMKVHGTNQQPNIFGVR